MKKIIAFVLVLLMLPITALAMVTPEQIEELSEADKTILKSNVRIAIDKKESIFGGKRYSNQLKIDLMELSVEELNWIYDYLNGETSFPFDGNNQTMTGKYGNDILPSEEGFSTNKRVGHPVLDAYFSVSEMDVPPVLEELLALWAANNILIDLPPKEYGARDNEKMSWDRYIIAHQSRYDEHSPVIFEIKYTIYFDGSGDFLYIQVPKSYKPLADMFSLAISYFTGKEPAEAEKIYKKLNYNVIQYKSSYSVGNIDFDYLEFYDEEILSIFRYFDK